MVINEQIGRISAGVGKKHKQMSEVKIMPCLIMPENMLFFREIYCVGKKFTLPALTNFTSGFDFMTNKPLSVAAEFNPWPLITSLCPGR